MLMRGTFTDEAGEKKGFLLSDGVGVGYGARADRRWHRCRVISWRRRIIPSSSWSSANPVRLRAYGIVKDSGGAGKFRGGCGIIREYEILADPGRARGPHRQRQEPALGYRWRHVRRRWPRRDQSRHAGAARAGPAVGRQICSSAATSCAWRRAVVAAMAIPMTGGRKLCSTMCSAVLVQRRGGGQALRVL